MQLARLITLTLCLGALATGCSKPAEPAGAGTEEATTAEQPAEETPKGPEAGPGFDLEKKVVKLGALNDESGPAAAIGKPYALGKRILAAQVNAGGTPLLPEGWKVELVEKDHGYNPQKAVQAYSQIKDEVALIVTSFGTPNTLPLRPNLERDNLIALPASLSSEMAAHKSTIPLGASYKVEAMRAVDHIIEQAGEDGKAKVKLGIVYQQDDYGKDGLDGLREAAKHHALEIVSEQTVTPGQGDFAAIITGLKDKGATHVMLTVLPSASGKLLGTAAQLQYAPVFYGATPVWVDSFFKPDVIPSAVFANYHHVTSMPFWGEERPGMKEFLEAAKKHGGDAEPNSYILTSYMQGAYALEVVKRAIEAGKPTREGLFEAVASISGWDGGGLGEPVSTDAFPYVVANRARVLRPDFEKNSWTVAGDMATPHLLGGDEAVAAADPTEGKPAEGSAAPTADKPAAEAAAAKAPAEPAKE